MKLAYFVVLAIACRTAFAGNGKGDGGNSNQNVVVLMQSDFTDGTYLITEPGSYRLGEDIVFDPNPPGSPGVLDAYDSGLPDLSGTSYYDPDAYRLGFFAAIAISAEGVDLDLNNHRIEQSAGHALVQRFFAVIELADQPFAPGQGPNNFGATMLSAKDVRIHDGVIGRSAHHGIHGNGNVQVVIERVDFVDFEVAAAALNGVNGLRVRDCTADNRKDVPILGVFSSAMQIKRYVDYLDDFMQSATTLNVRGQQLSISDVHLALRGAVNNVYEDVVTSGAKYINPDTHPEEYALFHNRFGLLDGNSYGFLLNKFGVAVHEFPVNPGAGFTMPATDVEFDNVRILNQSAFINEIVVLSAGGGAMIDPVGSAFQVKNAHPDTGAPITVSSWDDSTAEYVGNVVADAQLLVAKAAFAGEFNVPGAPDVSRLSITQAVLDWAESNGAQKLAAVSSDEGYLCNGDSMFHVNKGVIGFKLDASQHVQLNNIDIDTINNYGAPGATYCGGNHPSQTLIGYGGAETRAISLAGSSYIDAKNLVVGDVYSASGDALGVDVFTNSRHVEIKNAKLRSIHSPNGEAIGVRCAGNSGRTTVKNYCCGEEHAVDACAAERDTTFSNTFENELSNC